MVSQHAHRALRPIALGLMVAGAIVLTGPVGIQAAFQERASEPERLAAPPSVGPEQPADGGMSARLDFGLGTMRVQRDGVATFGVRPGGLRVESEDLVAGSYELLIEEPGEQDAGPLSLDLAFAASQPIESGAALLGPGSVRTSLGVVNVLVRDASGRHVESRLAGSSDGLRIDVQDASAVYPLSIHVSRVAPFSKTSAFSLGERGIGSPGNAGADFGGEDAPPLEARPVVSSLNTCHYLDVSNGTYFSLALGDDHLVYAWGAGESGQLGDASVAQRPTPAAIAGLSNINAIAAGGHHGMALDAAGMVWTWGANFDGQLGVGTIIGSAIPAPVPGLPPIVAIAAGNSHSLAVDNAGFLWAWGENGWGQLGDGTNNQRTSPVQVLAISGAVGVAAGYEHSLVRLATTTLVAFGRNDAGQLGDGTNTNALLPVPVSGLSGVAGMAGGWKHSLAWKSDGSAWAWGDNTYGQLGTGTLVPSNTPVAVGALPSDVVHMDAGSLHSLAIKADGLAHAWGANFQGQVGNGTTISPQLVPSPVAGVTNALRIAGGWEHSTVATGPGRVFSWGRNTEGELGLGIAELNTFPVHVLDSDLDGFLEDVTQVSAGASHSLAVKIDGSVWAWGQNGSGQLGDGSLIARTVPVQVMPPGSLAIAVAAGANHSLALLSNGQVRAWGSDSDGQLGNGAGGQQLVPGPVYSSGAIPLAGIVEIAAGNSFSLARNNPAGNVLSWGDDAVGQLGNGAPAADQQYPVNVKIGAASLVTIVGIDAGERHGLAVKGDGTVYAWGLNTNGQLGQGNVASPFLGSAIVSGLGPGSGAISVAAGDSHSLALFVGGTAKAWGKNSSGQLGDGTTVQRLVPVSVLGIAGIAELDGGTNFSIARVGGGALRAWGSNSAARLGDGSFTQRELPAVVRELSNVTQISAGTAHALAVKADANVWGWGETTLHQLGVDYKAAVTNSKRVNFGVHCNNQPPVCDAGIDILASCDGPTLDGSAMDPDDDPIEIMWTSNCEDVIFVPGPDVLDPQVLFGSDCGINCDFTLTVNDPTTGVCSDIVNVIVDDAAPPVGTMGSIDACYPSLAEAELAATLATDWTDNCAVGAEYVSTVGTCSATISVTAEDYCGNLSAPIQYVTRIDAVAPILSGVPADATVECSAIPAPATVTAVDDCDGPVSTSFSEVASGSLCGGAGPGTITRTWTAVDSCGNVATDSQVLTLEDTTDPVLHGVPADQTIQCGQAIPSASVSATDNCTAAPDLQLIESEEDGPCPGTRTITRTWTAYDDCSNFATATQVITVVDTLPPVLSGVPADETVSCASVPVQATVTATDSCDPVVEVTPNETRTNGACPDRYTLTRTWTATDDCGNTVVETQIVTVTDNVPPVLSGVPGPLTVECDSVPAPAEPTATDDCDAEPSVTLASSTSPGSCPQSYTLTRTWTATDRCGNSSAQSQVITVIDTTDPVLSGVPGPVTVPCHAIPAPAPVTATDNCGTPSVVMVPTITPGACADSYTLRRTWTATDECGNSSSAFQDITVIDDVDPVIAGVPADATVECNAVPAPASPTASDNCDPAPMLSYNQVVTPGSCDANFTITRTWTATDRCGNSSSQTQVLTVVDTTAPVLHGVPADQNISCPSVPPPATPTATDNCDPMPVIVYGQTRTNGPCPDTYTLTRTWTATDDCGNSSSRTQIINVSDTTAPTIAGVPPDVTVECSAVPAPASPTASDACDPAPALAYGEVRTNGACRNSYTLTRTWTATDRCNNSSSRQQIITVQDTQRPGVTSRNVDLYCLWPANHQYRMFTKSQFSPTINDNCTANPAWKFVGCQSNQPDDAAGGTDGNTVNDCVVDPAGQWFKVRAERDTKKAGGRRYSVTIVATDECFNNSTVTQIGYIYVPLKQPGDTCLQPDAGM